MTVLRFVPALLLFACHSVPLTDAPQGTDEVPDDCVDRFPDEDGDGYGDVTAEAVCGGPGVANNHDCDDSDPDVGRALETTWPDEDGDGFGDPDGAIAETCADAPGRSTDQLDCDDDNPHVWLGAAYNEPGVECMEDADRDGFGAAEPTSALATPGRDCDDDDPDSAPGGRELFGDGIDQDCDGADRVALADDFELGQLDPAVWGAGSGDMGVQSAFVHEGSYALNLGGGGGVAQTVTVDTSNCATSEIGFYYSSKRGPEMPDIGDDLVFELFDGIYWHELDRVPGIAQIEPTFEFRTGAVSDGFAFGPGRQFRFTSNGSGSDADDFYIDDVRIFCSVDSDGDGVDVEADCDDGDAQHWFDCGVCVDTDGDGYGAGCDLGADCDDGDAAQFPSGSDTFGDGVDSNCDGFDGGGLFDDFDSGALQWDTWPLIGAGTDVTTDFAYSPLYSLSLVTLGELESRTFDTSTCPLVVWGYWGKRGPSAPDDEDDLLLYWHDGSSWVQTDIWEGDSTIDPEFRYRWGELLSPSAFHPDMKLRFDWTGGFADDVYVDDVSMGCSEPDADGDGLPGALDCAPADGAHFLDCHTCSDSDGDGYGIGCDQGGDCDDGDAGVHPGAGDVLGDGIDSDCSGIDGAGLFDDFDTGAAGPTWDQQVGDVAYDSSVSFGGSHSLRLGGGGGLVESVSLDTTSCAAVQWSYQGKRGPDAPELGDDLILTWWDGLNWIEADRFEGTGVTDASFSLRSGLTGDPSARWGGFRVRLESVGGGPGTDHFYVDDLTVGCGVGDTDGDGADDNTDCDPADPAHWFDCALCVDGDGDDYGSACDLGPDCDDGDAAVNPEASDPFGDGVDSNCDGFDGEGLFDDFDSGVVDAGTWSRIDGGTVISTTYSVSGAHSLNIDDHGIAESTAIDTSTCPLLVWSYHGKRGEQSPAVGDDLVLSWDDGGTWVAADVWEGNGNNDADFSFRWGIIDDPAAMWSDLRVQLESTGGIADDFFVDDFTFACSQPDADGDTRPEALDCAPADPMHWADCGRCLDADGDGYGVDCDLGPDCNDGNPAVHPDVPDLVVDGLDANCSGVDGPGFFDDFELGMLGTSWESIDGFYSFDTAIAVGSYSLRVGGVTVVQTKPIDMSACPSVHWSYEGKRGPESPDTGDDLIMSYWDGLVWTEVHRFEGGAGIDPDFLTLEGVFVDPGALWDGFQLRLETDGAASSDEFYIDDLQVVCGLGDPDGDGFDDLVDCDPQDGAHWSDCGLCGDLDGDDHGVDCDLGADCDELQPAAYVGGIDLGPDGIDQDCSGVDGVGLFSDFDDGVLTTAWQSIEGDAEFDSTLSVSGGFSLKLGGGIGTAVSVPIDTSLCADLVWTYWGKRGPEAPDATDDLILSFWDGVAWVTVDTWLGVGSDDLAFSLRSGSITDSAAYGPGMQVQLQSDGTNTAVDDFYVDDFELACL